MIVYIYVSTICTTLHTWYFSNVYIMYNHTTSYLRRNFLKHNNTDIPRWRIKHFLCRYCCGASQEVLRNWQHSTLLCPCWYCSLDQVLGWMRLLHYAVLFSPLAVSSGWFCVPSVFQFPSIHTLTWCPFYLSRSGRSVEQSVIMSKKMSEVVALAPADTE